ncbi:hypothetical protein ACFLX3_02445 [Chloroflexota bacterium]
MRLGILPFSLDKGKADFPAVGLVFFIDVFYKALEVFISFVGRGGIIFSLRHTGFIIAHIQGQSQ